MGTATLALLAGCGGGGGGGGGGRKAQVTVDWPQRSRAIAAPSSALSVRTTLSQSGSPVATFIRNRSSVAAAHSETYSSNGDVAPGAYDAKVEFFTAADAGGMVVGQATFPVTLTEGSGDLGTVAIDKVIASVTIAAGQSVAVGADKDLAFTARTAANAIVVVSAPSAQFAVTSGADRATIVQGRVHGVASGLPQVTATVDGVTSAPRSVGVGTANYGLTASGTRGAIVVDAADSKSYTLGSGQVPVVTSDWFGDTTAPARYADRAFSAWKVGGVTVGNSPTLTELPATVSLANPLTAVYVTSLPAGGIFTPNYNTTDFSFWPSFPIKVWIDPTITGSDRQAILDGIERWHTAAGDAITFTETTTQSQGQIKIQLGPVPVGSAGQTQITGTPLSDGTTRLAGASINLSAALLPANTDSKVALLRAIASHEFGHALGIGGTNSGHSPDSKDTMFATVTQNTLAITERDINTIANIYFARFGVTRHRAVAAPAAAGETVTRTFD